MTGATQRLDLANAFVLNLIVFEAKSELMEANPAIRTLEHITADLLFIECAYGWLSELGMEALCAVNSYLLFLVVFESFEEEKVMDLGGFLARPKYFEHSFTFIYLECERVEHLDMGFFIEDLGPLHLICQSRQA